MKIRNAMLFFFPFQRIHNVFLIRGNEFSNIMGHFCVTSLPLPGPLVPAGVKDAPVPQALKPPSREGTAAIPTLQVSLGKRYPQNKNCLVG